MNVFFSQILKCFYVGVNISIPIGRSCLNGIMYIHAFDSRNMKPRSFHFLFQRPDPLTAPYFSGRRIIQCRDDSRYPRNLSDLF